MARPATIPPTSLEPTLPAAPDLEKKLAAAMHAASIFAPLWFPFLVWVVAKSTKTDFLRAHARQAAFEGIVWKAILLILMVVSLTVTIVRLFHHISTNFSEFQWDEVAFRVILSLVVFVTLWLINFVQSLFQATAAYKGTWPKRERKRHAKALKAINRTP